MESWLREYEEWVILAAGIVLVTSIVGFIGYRMTRRKTPPRAAQPDPVPPLPPVTQLRKTPPGLSRPEAIMALPSQPRADLAVLALGGTRPPLQEILTKLRRAPAHQREALIDSFFGYPVSCPGEVKSAVKLPSGKLLIDLVASDVGEDVFLEVFPGNYPTIDLTQPGLKLVASGRFRSSASVLWLDDAELAV
ncbi:MAG TPA: hypothetical protein VGP80_11725 [Gemmatimonadales bacterium]|nr:hypothetical protein [Gemmatimonadales bacterium]